MGETAVEEVPKNKGRPAKGATKAAPAKKAPAPAKEAPAPAT